MNSFNKAVGISIVALVAFCIICGFAYSWCLSDMSNFGQFVGGIAGAVALGLVAYGLMLQQYQISQQNDSLRDTTETQFFNLLYGTLVQRSNDFYCLDNGIEHKGIVALEILCENYKAHQSIANIQKLKNQSSSVEAFIRCFYQVINFTLSVKDHKRFVLLNELVLHQYKKYMTDLIKIGATNLAIDDELITKLGSAFTKVSERLAEE
ncbi:hypothetical protein [Bdellovibrio sp. KM01]|uniref:hypothetical protein n=1 Tax=Bdellovibrio sp. KM01 TaxID=2748865 RepID=UPI0015E95316|nr:hypothetical protein [Bdellovibrio sp. KM01]QLY24896.1 hypothetical protein HW988_15910 [Bdellovibrio sp. KM01]